MSAKKEMKRLPTQMVSTNSYIKAKTMLVSKIIEHSLLKVKTKV